jgi:hypothetical protein
VSEIEEKLKELESVHSWTEPFEMFNALQSAIVLIKVLRDEAGSAWALLEELRASEVAAHSENLKKELDRKITETLGLIRSKVVLA